MTRNAPSRSDLGGLPAGPEFPMPTIVCLCGSTRSKDEFAVANFRETLAGKIVLSIGCDAKTDAELGITDDVKARLDELRLRKIDLADEVLILNVGGYIGESTSRNLHTHASTVSGCGSWRVTMSHNIGLPKLPGGIAKAWREAWEKPCQMRGCGRPAAGVIETLSGPKPICAEHIPGAERHGYTVHRKARL